MDIVVVGGGVIGLWTAVALAAEPDIDVVLIERGDIGAGATARAVGIIRERHSDPVWRRLASTGWSVYRQRFPDLSPVDLLVARPIPGAEPKRLHRYVFGPGEGVEETHALRVAPTRVMSALLAKASRVDVRCGVTAVGVEDFGGRVTGVVTTAGTIACGGCVIACGGETDLLAARGISLPVRRQPVDVVALDGPASGPVLLDFCVPGGLYLAPNGQRWVVSSPPRPHGDGWAPDPDALVRAARSRLGSVPARVVSRERGCYDVTPDQRPVVGPVPGVAGCWVATGFAGSGLQVAPAVAELLVSAVLSPDRAGPSDLAPARFAKER